MGANQSIYGPGIGARPYRRNDWSPLLEAQGRLFRLENKHAKFFAKYGVYQRGRINELMKEAAMLWEGAVAFQAQAKQQHASGATIPAQASMQEARRLAREYNRMVEEAQRLLAESQAMGMQERYQGEQARNQIRQQWVMSYTRMV